MSAVASTNNTPQRCYLVELPTELQLMIYRYLLHTKKKIRIDIGGDSVPRGVYPSAAILRTCKSIHAICDDILYTENHFKLVVHTDIFDAESCKIVSRLAHLLRRVHHLMAAVGLMGSQRREVARRLAKELARNPGLKSFELYFYDMGVSAEQCGRLALPFHDVRVKGEVSVSSYRTMCTGVPRFSNGIGMSEECRAALEKAMRGKDVACFRFWYGHFAKEPAVTE